MAKFKLSKSVQEQITKSLREMHDVLPVVDNAEKCGMECQQYREELNRQRESLEKLKQYFVDGQ